MYHDVSVSDFIAPSIEFRHKHGDAKEYFEMEMKKFKV
jgi:hypothetical protein